MELTLSNSCLLSAGGHRLPPVMHPKPIGWVAARGRFERSIDIEHDGSGRPRLTVFTRCNFRPCFNPPASQSDAIANPRIKSAIVTQRKNRRSGRGGTVV